jgi:hypothetical protein
LSEDMAKRMFNAPLELERPEPYATVVPHGEMAVASDRISLELTFLS